jgi:flagellar hook-basal body complex protein FliE
MNLLRPELTKFSQTPNLPLNITHHLHMPSDSADFLSEGRNISDLGRKIGADAVIRSGTFSDAMLNALDQVSAAHQFSSNLSQMAISDPDSVNVEDVSIAMAQARLSLDITRNVLNRVVQGWRDLINTR